MSEPYYLRSGEHVLIAGATGAGEGKGGKTGLANWWFSNAVEKHSQPDIGVFVNPKEEGYIRGTTVTSLVDLRDALADGDRVFDYRLGTNETDAHEHLIRFLRSVRGEKIVVHDEPLGYRDSDLLEWCARKGGNISNSDRHRSGNIMSLFVSQHPWDLPEKLTSNIPVIVWVGPTNPQARRFFQQFQATDAYDRVDRNAEPYHWAVIDGAEFVSTNPPVPAEYAGG